LNNLITKTKFIGPAVPQINWVNKKIWQQYSQSKNYPVTVIQAGPGYGKSTTIASYFNENYQQKYYWYSIDELDSDPALFFLNFIHAFKYKDENLGDEAISFLNQSGDKGIPLKQVIDIFINELLNKLDQERFIILDDFHLVNKKDKITNLLAYFIKRIPPFLHVIISTRNEINLPQFAQLKLKRQLLLIKEEEFSLSREEINYFLEAEYDLNLNKKDLNNIYQETEGWIIAVDLIGEGLKSGTKVSDIIKNKANSLDLLFEYLAYEVLENQSQKIKEFLLKTAVLKYLRVEICNELLEIENSEEIINYIIDKKLFTYYLGNNQFRYHHLFHEFLEEQGKKRYDYQKLHSKVADICLRNSENGFAIYHSLKAKDFDKAAEIILSSADKLLELGRLETLDEALKKLPDSKFKEIPRLYMYEGDIYRLQSHFDQALDSYQKARKAFLKEDDKFNLSLILQKMAMIYLDTVQPLKAEEYLKKALKIRDQESLWVESDLLKLMAENKANEGHLEEAKKLYDQAEDKTELEISNNNFTARVKLRTGKLREAQKLLAEKVGKEKVKTRQPRSHRETILILSLIDSFMGNIDTALNYAEDGIYLGEELNSPFIKAVAYMRLGHAYQLSGKDYIEKSRKAYNNSLKIIEKFNIPRGKAEPLMGLALLEAFYGDCELGLKYGREGLHTAEQAGDEWLSGIIQLSISLNYYFQGDFDQAEKILLDNIVRFKKLNDQFLKSINRLWLVLIYYKENKLEKFDIVAKNLLEIVKERKFEFLFNKNSLFTGNDLERFVPVLLTARDRSIEKNFVQGILAELGYSKLKNHPGYQLKIEAFGNLKVWQGKKLMQHQDWEREKAKELFLLFLLHLGETIPKEQIYYYLWPEKSEKKAGRNFKVTLNALKNALEPDRKPRQKPFFIIRHGSSYGFNKNAAYIYDVEEFNNLIKAGNKAKLIEEKIKYYQSALNLYKNDFVLDKLYLDWIRNERDRLKNLFLNTGDKLIELYFKEKSYSRAIELADRLLEVDNCFEKAYYFKMKSYKRLKRRSMAVKVYKNAAQILDRELNISPNSQLREFYNSIL
jgi:ATP/maltotriose-dependent transcriptional regulator MalT/DNA-binding SARP family transcriptional activator